MTLTKLTLKVSKAGYSFTDGLETLYVKLDGGAGRFRRDISGAANRVNVAWNTGRGGFDYLRAFYRNTATYSSTPFLIDLSIDGADVEEYEAYFIPGSMSVDGVSGNTYSVSAQLEVKPNTPDEDYDAAIVSLFNEYGSLEDLDAVLNQLEQLANVDLPNEL